MGINKKNIEKRKYNIYKYLLHPNIYQYKFYVGEKWCVSGLRQTVATAKQISKLGMKKVTTLLKSV